MSDFVNSFARPDWPGSPDLRTLLLMIVLGFSLGLLIGFVYMWTHEALSYSRTFVGALAVMPLIMAMMMAAMFGSLLVAFGLLAVFGVVRFRNVLKDTRDTTFILWAIVEGLAVGTTRFSIALMAAAGISAAFLVVRLISFGTRQRYDAVLSLRVTGDFQAQMPRVRQVLDRHARPTLRIGCYYVIRDAPVNSETNWPASQGCKMWPSICMRMRRRSDRGSDLPQYPSQCVSES